MYIKPNKMKGPVPVNLGGEKKGSKIVIIENGGVCIIKGNDGLIFYKEC